MKTISSTIMFTVKSELWETDSEHKQEMIAAYSEDGGYIGHIEEAMFLAKKGIKPQLDGSGASVCTIGFCEKEQKWYGWSHRARSGFGLDSKVEEGDILQGKYLIGYKPSNLDDAKKMAIYFADAVG